MPGNSCRFQRSLSLISAIDVIKRGIGVVDGHLGGEMLNRTPMLAPGPVDGDIDCWQIAWLRQGSLKLPTLG
jgi:hypothetical protein